MAVDVNATSRGRSRSKQRRFEQALSLIFFLVTILDFYLNQASRLFAVKEKSKDEFYKPTNTYT